MKPTKNSGTGTCFKESVGQYFGHLRLLSEPSSDVHKLLLSAKHDLPMPNLFITSGWAYLCFMTSPLIRFPYRQEVLQMPVQA